MPPPAAARRVARVTRIELTPELFDLPAPIVAAPTEAPAYHVRAALDTRLRALLRHDPGTRAGEDIEDLHQMRVAVRRMRAALRAARPLLDPAWADGLRAELGWLGRALGPVRDLDVLLERLTAESADLPADERAAAARLIADLETERATARRAMLHALGSTRYTALLERLADAVRLPLPTPSATRRQPELRHLVQIEYRKLRDAVWAAGPNPPDDALHALRIRGKRLRYTAELAEPALGRPVQRLIKATVAFQDVLGEHQDACVAGQRIRSLLDGLDELPDIQVAFVAGRLVEHERARADETRSRWWEAWEAVAEQAAGLP